MPKEFVWHQIMRTDTYSSRLGLDFPPLPERFSEGTRLNGRETTAVVGEYPSDHSLHLYFDDRLLVLEVGGGRWAGPVLVGAQDYETNVRLCLDIFYPSSFARMFASTKKQEDEAGALLRRFVGHCQNLHLAEGK